MTSDILKLSRYWAPLWRIYSAVPSVALCRVPELEYAATLDARPGALDHCCGDGLFAALAWPGRPVRAGCDLDRGAIAAARRRGHHVGLDVCDAGSGLPYRDGAFRLVFNNSALEHIADLDAALREIARVLRPGGTFAFNVLNRRYFDWWPLGRAALEGYRRWQPFYHALALESWERRLRSAGLQLTSVAGYFDRSAARDLAFLDCEFSGHFAGARPSRFVRRLWPLPLVRRYWHRRLSARTWKTGADEGAGYFLVATQARG